MNLKVYKPGLAAALLYLALSACSSNKKAENKAPATENNETLVQVSAEQARNINLETGKVDKQSISNILKLSGQIDVPPQNLVSVSIPMGGYLKSTAILPGTQVQRGQVLAIMEDPQYIQLQQDYLSAANKLNFAIKEYDRQKELNRTKASSDKVLQQAEIELKNLNIETRALAAKLSLIGISVKRLSEYNISRTIKIYSPINGFVSKVNVNIGRYVTPSDVIFELINPADIHLNLTVYEKDLSKLSIGQHVTAYSNANVDKKYDTKIILVSHSLNQNRSAEVHCHFEQYDKSLMPGMFMNAEIKLDNNKEDVLPDQAIVNFENKDYVFIQESDLAYRLTPVQKGQSENGLTVVRSSLNGKRIVTTGAYSLLMKLKNSAE